MDSKNRWGKVYVQGMGYDFYCPEHRDQMPAEDSTHFYRGDAQYKPEKAHCAVCGRKWGKARSRNE